MSASQNNLALSLTQQDASGTNILKRLIEVTYAGVVGDYKNGILTSTGATAITVPTTNVMQFLFRNTHATANIVLNLTGATGTALIKVPALGAVAIWAASTGASGAITAITGTADVVNATYEMFLGG